MPIDSKPVNHRKSFKTLCAALDYQKQHPRLTVYVFSSVQHPRKEFRWVVCIRRPLGADIAHPALSIDDPNIRYRKRRQSRASGGAVIEVLTHGQLYLQYPIAQDGPALRHAIGTFLRSHNRNQKRQAARHIMRALSQPRSP